MGKISVVSPLNSSSNIETVVVKLVNDALNLDWRVTAPTPLTPLRGAVPELDSMGVVALIAAIEEHFDITIDDSEIDGEVFRTVGTLMAFIVKKLEA